MPISDLEFIMPVIYYSILPGGAGGVATFVLGLHKGHYKNNKYCAKCVIEIVGAALTASFLTIFVDNQNFRIGIAFLIGVGWTGVLQAARNKITKIVEAALGEQISGGKK